MTEAGPSVQRRDFDSNRRVDRIEKRINSIDDELQLVRADAIDKHKEELKQIENLRAEFIRLEGELEEANKLIERLTNMLGEFASKESVKVLEKYINLWSPIKYTTKTEVEDLIASAVKKPAKKRKAATKSKKK